MRPIPRILGLLLVVLGPTGLAAQGVGASGGPYRGPATTPPQPYVGFDSRTDADRQPPRTGVLQASYSSPVPQTMSNLGTPAQRQGGPAPTLPLPPAGREPPLPLAPPGRADRSDGQRTGGLASAVAVAGSLAVVLGIFFVVAWAMRRSAPAATTVLPNTVFEVLGRAPMAARQQAFLLRCGNKLVLASVTPAGAETLTEITDPTEVDRLAGLCHQARPDSATAAFRQVFRQFAAAPDGLEDRDA